MPSALCSVLPSSISVLGNCSKRQVTHKAIVGRALLIAHVTNIGDEQSGKLRLETCDVYRCE